MKALIALVTTSLALSACSNPTEPQVDAAASAAQAKAALVAASTASKGTQRLAAN